MNNICIFCHVCMKHYFTEESISLWFNSLIFFFSFVHWVSELLDLRGQHGIYLPWASGQSLLLCPD